MPVVLGQFVLPDAKGSPATAAEFEVDAAVASHVVGELPAPEGAVGLGGGCVLRTAVPKAAVDKNGEALLGEGEIGGSRELQMTSPTRDRSFSK
jgi:hypothetical protein